MTNYDQLREMEKQGGMGELLLTISSWAWHGVMEQQAGTPMGAEFERLRVAAQSAYDMWCALHPENPLYEE